MNNYTTRNKSYAVRPLKGTIVKMVESTYNGGPVPVGTEIVVRSTQNAGFRGIELNGYATTGPRAGDYLVGISTGKVRVILK